MLDCIFNDIQCKGDDSEIIGGIKSVEDCQEYCNTISMGCKYFTYNKKFEACRTFTGHYECMYSKPGFQSGPPQCPSSCKKLIHKILVQINSTYLFLSPI